jgi:type IV pilus assembly protein PilQ
VQKDRVRARVWVQAVGAAGLLVSTGLGPLAVAQQAYSTTGTVSPSALPMELRVRRVRDGVEVVIENTGSAPQLEQTNQGGSWLGRLTTSRPAVLLRGPQAVALPEAGVRSLSIEGSGTVFTLRAMAVGGTPMRPPLVSADGRNVVLSFAAPLQATLQTTQRNSLAPGAVANPNFVPPLRARATAPPVGDMAVGTMVIANPSYVNVSGPPVTMTIKNAQAKNVLMALSQLGGYGFVYVDEDAGSNQEKGSASLPRPITISFRNEKYGRAINSALMAAGIQGKREGNTIFAGPRVLGKSLGPQVSKVFRLNQISSNSAADYLANLGASVTKTNTVTTSVTQGGDQNQPSGAPNSATTQTGATTTVEAYGASTGPLIGLRVTTDVRLSTITLVGDSSVVNVAEQYLRQLDIRQRQVALGVKILDVGLSNDNRISNSFAFKSGNTFILNDNGVLSAIFGSSTLTAIPGETNPGASNPDQSFIDSLRAVIQSSSTKVLASPTLILSENPEQIQKDTSVSDDFKLRETSYYSGPIGRLYANESFVTVGEQVVTSYTTQDSATGAPPTCIPIFSNAGLTFGARINRIDDNGFVSFSLSPEISAVTGGLPISIGNCGSIQIVNRRRLDTGNLRVRDGQTLVLTGVISDDDRATVSKWPILGDIPLVGQFFRNSGTSRKKSELVIMVTPRIINDTEGGTYGYGFEPSTQGTRQFMNPSPSSAMPGFMTQP